MAENSLSDGRRAKKRPAVPSQPVQWPLKALIFSNVDLYNYTLQRFGEHFPGQSFTGHPPYRLIHSRDGSGYVSLNDCAVMIECALDPLDGPVRKGPIWNIAPELWHDIAAYFDDLVHSGRVALSGRWNSYGSSWSSVPPDVFPENLAEALAHGDLDIGAGTLRIPNGEVVYSIQFKPPAEHLRDHEVAEDISEKTPIRLRTARAQTEFRQFLTETISSSPNAVTKKRDELIAIGIEMGVAESAAKKIRQEVIAELSLKNSIISEVWTAPGRPPDKRPK